MDISFKLYLMGTSYTHLKEVSSKTLYLKESYIYRDLASPITMSLSTIESDRNLTTPMHLHPLYLRCISCPLLHRNLAMTELLEQAIAKLKNLPATEQDAIAAMILAELEDERRWDEAFARSSDMLAKLAAEAMAEYRAGKTQELDPDRL